MQAVHVWGQKSVRAMVKIEISSESFDASGFMVSRDVNV